MTAMCREKRVQVTEDHPQVYSEFTLSCAFTALVLPASAHGSAADLSWRAKNYQRALLAEVLFAGVFDIQNATLNESSNANNSATLLYGIFKGIFQLFDLNNNFILYTQ